jgi:hypothetical protein
VKAISYFKHGLKRKIRIQRTKSHEKKMRLLQTHLLISVYFSEIFNTVWNVQNNAIKTWPFPIIKPTIKTYLEFPNHTTSVTNQTTTLPLHPIQNAFNAMIVCVERSQNTIPWMKWKWNSRIKTDNHRAIVNTFFSILSLSLEQCRKRAEERQT